MPTKRTGSDSPAGRPRPRAARRGAGLGAQAGRPGADRDRGDQEALPPTGPRRRAPYRVRGLRARLRLGGRGGGHLRVPREAQALVQGAMTAGPHRGAAGQPAAWRTTTSARAERLADLLRDAECAVVLTGAGVSLPSGIP